MLKKSVVALAAVIVGAAAAPALAAPALQCEAPVIQVSSQSGPPTAQFSIACQGADALTVMPAVTFTGEMVSYATPPHLVNATYHLSVQDAHGKKVGQDAREDQVALGTLQAATMSIAALPSQFAHLTEWDAHSGTISIQEKPGVWRAFVITPTADAGTSVSEAGTAATPVKNGTASAAVEFGKSVSRFAGKKVHVPVLAVQLGLRDGKFEVLVGETRAAATKSVQDALLLLDKAPTDIARAWRLAAIAQFLGLSEELRYAEKQVAAHHPQWLEEFQYSVKTIKPFTLQK